MHQVVMVEEEEEGNGTADFKHCAVLRAKFTTGDNIDFLKWWAAKL